MKGELTNKIKPKETYTHEELVKHLRNAYSVGASEAFGKKIFHFKGHENNYIKNVFDGTSS